MFTGLIQDIGTVTAVTDNGVDKQFKIETRMPLDSRSIGASIACNGCCLTITEADENSFSVDVSRETLGVTSLGKWVKGIRVNLEPSLRLGDEMGGHIVSGHVDGLAILQRIEKEGESYRLIFEIPETLSQYIAPKGSVTLDGISLTVNEVEGHRFGVNIIPHSWQNTTLQFKQPGDAINLEIDMLARYVARMMERQAA